MSFEMDSLDPIETVPVSDTNGRMVLLRDVAVSLAWFAGIQSVFAHFQTGTKREETVLVRLNEPQQAYITKGRADREVAQAGDRGGARIAGTIGNADGLCEGQGPLRGHDRSAARRFGLSGVAERGALRHCAVGCLDGRGGGPGNGCPVRSSRRQGRGEDPGPGEPNPGCQGLADVVGRTKRTQRIEIDVTDTDHRIRPGLYGAVSIIAEEHPQVLGIPTTALFRHGDAIYCVCLSDGKSTRRRVEPVFTDGPDTEIVSGLDGTKTVVTAKPAAVAGGQVVPTLVIDPHHQ